MQNIDSKQQLKNYLKKEQVTNPNFIFNEEYITIVNRLFNGKIISDIVILFLIVIISKQNIDNEYGIIGLIFSILFIYFLWNDYDPINNVTIDLKLRTITIRTRNIIKYIFLKKVSINFEEIEKFHVTSTGFGRGQSRYKLKLISKLKGSFSLMDFALENDAAQIMEIFQTLI